MRIHARFFLFLTLLVGFAGCSKEPLTKAKAQELLEASSDFLPQKINVTLTPEEIKKGTDAGYWTLVEMNRTNSQLSRMQMLSLSPVGASYFRGTPALFNPVLSLNEPLGTKLVEIKEIQEVPGNPKEKTVTFTYIPKFEYALPEIAELLKDQGPRDGKKTFVYGKNGWELKP